MPGLSLAWCLEAVASVLRLRVGGWGCREGPEAAQDRTLRGVLGGLGVAGTGPGGPHCLAGDAFPIARSTCCYSLATRRFIEVPRTICSTLQ